MTLVTDTVAAARAALRGEPGPQILARGDGEPAIAFLVTLSRAEGDLVVPLRAGRTVVGRGTDRSWPQPYAAEQAQWLIECDAPRAEVWDAGSTNLSVLLPGAIVDGVELGHMLTGFQALFALPGAIPLPHPNEPGDHRRRYPLHEGDVLRGCYAAFAFGWR